MLKAATRFKSWKNPSDGVELNLYCFHSNGSLVFDCNVRLSRISSILAAAATTALSARPTHGYLSLAASSGIEQIAYPCGEVLLCERLLDHCNARIEPTLVDDGVSGITRRE